MQIVAMQERDKDRWDEYVRHSPYALPQHLSGWQAVMQRTYGYQTHYLIAFDGREIQGVLPLFVVRSWLLGRRLTTLPGGLCAENELAAHVLIEWAKKLAHAERVSRLTLHDVRQPWNSDLLTVNHHVSSMLALPDTVEAAWKGLKKKLRREVSIGLKHEVTAKITREPEQLEQFYQVFSIFTQKMGTPIYSRAFLRNVIESFADQYHICVLYYEGQVIGAFFNLEFGDAIYGLWGASLPEFYHLHTNYVAYWKMLEFGIENGFQRYDLGRSQLDSGPHKFKRKWRGQEQAIYQQHYWVKQQAATFDNPKAQLQNDKKFRLFSNVWRKLPLPVTQAVGPQVRKHIPFG